MILHETFWIKLKPD